MPNKDTLDNSNLENEFRRMRMSKSIPTCCTHQFNKQWNPDILCQIVYSPDIESLNHSRNCADIMRLSPLQLNG